MLIVEDEPSIALMYRLRLERDGYDVLWEANGRSGLDRVREDPPDLILLDVRLPDIDGFQVLQQITADPGLRAIPVVFLSNLGEPDLVTTGLRLGARDFVIKSKVTPGDLSDLLPNWLPPRPTGA